MFNYKFFHHTADAKFQAFGQTLEETFSHAALAVASLMWDWKKIAKNIDIPLIVEGKDLEQLLVNFLEEILYLLDTRNFLLGLAENVSLEKKDGTWSLHALFRGDVNEGEYEIYGDVKAITYNEIIINDREPFMVQVVADI
ncbi:MAG: archease [Candidatus Aminicenantes bacterium]|nr:MAG: archease [Candidatus Aminicenantes bacterium]